MSSDPVCPTWMSGAISRPESLAGVRVGRAIDLPPEFGKERFRLCVRALSFSLGSVLFIYRQSTSLGGIMNKPRTSNKVLSKTLAAMILIVAVALGAAGCATKNTTTQATKKLPAATNMILATTTSTADTGLLDYLLPIFDKKYNVKTKPIAVGSGEAIAMGQRGEADVLLVHSRAAEDKFMAGGYGSLRKDVMYNDFVIIGPSNDPAKIKGKGPADALAAIAAAQAPFVTRGDNSGTYNKEVAIWKKAAITPSGAWYVNVGQGMGEATKIANEKQAYILIDRGTFLSLKKSISLVILVEGQKDLFNPYGVIMVNKAKFAKVNDVDAKKFVDWITSPDVQKLIGKFGIAKYGQALFTPSAATGNP
jgi:tungstate transport system substrate-binding protein